MAWKQRWERVLGHPQAPVWVACVGLLLLGGSLKQGFQMDDYVQQMHIFGIEGIVPKAERPWLEFFAFVRNKEALKEYQRRGIAPWWSAPDLKMAFFRPFSSMTHLFDYRVWPSSPWLMHLQSLLWFGLLLLLLMRLLSGLGMERWLAAGVGLLYGTFHGFAAPVSWLANRNAVIAAVFGLTCLWFHHRGRQEKSFVFGLFASLAFGLGLLSGESAIAVCGYLFAYAVFLDPAGWKGKAASLVPYGLLVVGWRVMYKILDFGVYGSGLYIDPLHDPLRFFWALLERVPLLLFGQWGFPPISLYTPLPAMAQTLFWLWTLGGLAFCILLFWPLRRLPLARFFGLGMVLAVIPICATFPDDRLLFFVGVGGFSLLALFFAHLSDPSTSAPWLGGAAWKRRIAKVGFWGLFVIHAVLSPPLAAMRSFQMEMFDSFIQKGADTLPLHKGKEAYYVVLGSFNSFFDMNVIPRLMWQKRIALSHHYVLGPATEGSEVNVLDAQTLVIRPKGGFLQSLDPLFRAPAIPFVQGQRLQSRDLQIEIRAITKDGRPTEVLFRFSHPLHSARFVFLTSTKDGYKEVSLPAIGKTLLVPPLILF